MFDRLPVLVFSEQLPFGQFSIAWVSYGIVLEVNDFFQVGCLHPKKISQVAGNRLEKPNMYNRRSQIDMPHTLSSDTAVSHLYAAPITDDALELGALVLATGALVVTLRSEDAFAE